MTRTVEPMLSEKFEIAKENKSSAFGQIIATISVCVACLSAGTTLSWSSPCLSELEDRNSSTSFHISGEEASWAGSLLPIGALISAIPAGYCADKFGRKNSILSLSTSFILSWIFIIKGTNIVMLYIGRLLAGFGTGAICVLAPLFISEITEDRLRGPLCSFFALFLCTGIVLPFIVALFAKYILLSTILAIFPILFCISFIFIPETPIYLLKNNQEKLARKSLTFLRGKNADISEALADIKKDIQNSNEEKVGINDIIKNWHYRKCLIACSVLFFFQQFSGINAVIFYTVPIFKASKSDLNPLISSILISLIQVFVTILVIFIIDKQGRKKFILQSSAGNCISLGILALSFQLLDYQLNIPGLNLIPLISLMVFIFSFSIGLGPVPWLILGELLSPEIAGTIFGIGVMVNWSSGFVVTKCFGPMMAALGPYITFYIFSILNGLCILCVYFFVPETKDRTYQEIQNKWRK